MKHRSIHTITSELRKRIRQNSELRRHLRRKKGELETLRRQIERLKEQNKELKEEIKQLRGVPDWVKPNIFCRSKRVKKKGARVGHRYYPRRKIERIDRELSLVSKECPCCSSSDLSAPSQWHEHVQIDIPPPVEPIVTRYRVAWHCCRSCKKLVSNSQHMNHSLYGPHLHSQVSYWKYHLGLSLGKIQNLLCEQYDLKISVGTLSKMLSRTSHALGSVYGELGSQLSSQSHLYADETSWRVAGRNSWLWSFSNESLSYYWIDRSRSQSVVSDLLGESYSGILVSDFYGAYNALKSMKQKCWVHLLRSARELCEQDPRNRSYRRYKNRLKSYYDLGVSLQKRYESGSDVSGELSSLRASLLKFASQSRGSPSLSRLSKRIIKYQDELYTFVTSGVSGSNNAAEREIRPAVLQRKISYGNRSDQGAYTQALIMSIIRTWNKNNISFTQNAPQYLIQKHHISS